MPESEPMEGRVMEAIDEAGYTLLSIDAETALRAGRLIGNHRDPFDRIIAAHALAMDIPVISLDPKLDQFGVRRIW
jgi:PIN domain nuclease of toxin-antitoxin system